MFQKLIISLKERIGEAIVVFSYIPGLAKIGYAWYGRKPKDSEPPLANMGEITPNLVRGAQPTERGFTLLKKMQFNTIVNLRPETEWEKPIVEGLGMRYIYLPLPAVGQPTLEEGEVFVSIANNPNFGKIFFHCLHGADRTGAMAAAYRMKIQGWTLEQSLAEMPKFGFNEGFENDKLEFLEEFAAQSVE
jgi:tyrosine-protein phosphatase SIW14